MLYLAEKEFKVAIMCMCKNVKENKMAINEQVETYSSKFKIIKKNKMVILELKYSKIKIYLVPK